MEFVKLYKEKISSVSTLEFTIGGIGDLVKKELGPILRFISKNKKEKDLSPLLKKYFVIRAVTIFEDYFKDSIASLIDNFGVSAQKIVSQNQLEIPLTMFELVKKRNVTKGKVIATNFNCQDPDVVNKLMTTILEVNFFEEIKRFAKNHFIANTSSVIKKEDLLVKNWDYFFTIFDLRHAIVHTTKHSANIGFVKLDIYY